MFFLTCLLISCKHEYYYRKTLINITQKNDFNYKYSKIKLDSLFIKFCSKSGFNGAILVAKNDVILYQNYSGFADYETKDTLNLNSVFHLASVSKQFVATSIIYLKIQEKLKYSDKVSEYLEEFPYHEITILDLLNHTSGLPNYVKLQMNDEFYSNPSNETVYNFFCNLIPELNFNSGERFEYSNTNYVFLSLIIEKISGKKLFEFLNSTFFERLDMKNTFIYNDSLTYRVDAKGYFSKGNKSSINIFDYVYGDKEIYSTTEDLFKWDKALYNNEIISKSELDTIFNINESSTKKISSDKKYNFGWVEFEIKNYGKTIYHTGHWGGYNSLFFRDITNHNTIIILCNVINDEIYFNFESFLSILEPDFKDKNINLYSK